MGDEGHIKTSFDLEEGRVVDEVRRRRARVVGVQLPEGLKRHASALASLIEGQTGAVVVVSADPCYGACDLAEEAFAPLGVELVVHYGHDELGEVERRIPTVFVEARARLDPEAALRAAVPLLPKGGRVGLLATAQHREALGAARSALEAAGMTPVVGQGGRRLAFPGQVLGCDLSAARAVGGQVDAFLVLGGGNFHAAGVALATGRPVVVADVETGTAGRADGARDATLRARAAAIARARDARTFGILVGSKPGQRRWELALRLREQLLAAGKAPVLLSVRELAPERMLALGLDAYVSTACPRIAVDDQAAYPRPMLTPQEVRIALGLERWEDYRLDEIG